MAAKPKTAKPKPTPKKPVRHRAKAAVKRHYTRVMPNRKRHRILVWVVFLFVVSTIAVQMMYPLDRAVPLARLGDRWVGWQTHQQLTVAATKAFAASKITLQAGDTQIKDIALPETGAEVSMENMAARLEHYPYWQRWIPLSILWQTPKVSYYALEYSPDTLGRFAKQQAGQLSVEPVNASLEFSDNRLVATNESNGQQVATNSLREALLETPYKFGQNTTVEVPYQLIAPEKSSKDFDEVRKRAEQVLQREVVVQIEQQTLRPDQAERATWLRLSANEAGQTELTLNPEGVAGYVKSLNDKYSTAATQTHVTMINGIQTQRQEGTPGRAVTTQQFSDQLQTQLLQGNGVATIRAELAPLAPTVIYNNSYTATQQGLQAYADDQARRGAWISIRQIGGEGWSVDARSLESVPSASTYKVFVARELFNRMDAGQISWNDPILDTTVSGCFDRMTIASTNACAREWLQQFGRQSMNDSLYALGFSRGTTFTHPDAVHTTAADLTKLMVGIENGSYMNGANRDRLYRSLSTHPYRYGIAKGSQGRVYDKVGFLWDYVHDTAIVYHPRGTYVMTIMTKGQSYAAIAAMTRQIEALMYP